VEPTLADLERLLSRSQAEPRPAFLCELEASLLRSLDEETRRPARTLRNGRRSRLLVGLAFAVTIATLMLVLSIAGLRPLGTSGTSGAQADRRCTVVEVRTLVRRPTLVIDANGGLRISERTVRVLQPRIRCR
jgi:hypothetical protein